MNDIFKFRIPFFEKETKKFKEYAYFNLGQFIPYEYNVIYGEIEQFTGLKDKNEKFIYSGDIIRLKQKNDKYLNCYVEYVVERSMYNSSSGFVLKNKNCTICFSSKRRMEVIGNIHNNKNLLKGK